MAAATIITNVVTGGTNNHATVASEANAYATDFVSQGVLGLIGNTGGVAPCTGSFGLSQNTGSDMAIQITGTGNTTSGASIAYVTVTPASQEKQVLRARMSANYTAYTINANVSGSTVYDWIYLQASATNANNPDAGADNVVSVVTSRSTSNNTDNGTPPTYGILLGVVTVANGASAITNANIADRRTQLVLNTGGGSSSSGWVSLPNTPNSVTYNGNRSYSLVFNSIDLTGTISPGTRLRTTRTATAPTQCTSLNGTNQFFNKTSPAGMTFTNFPVAMAWIKLSSYAGSDMIIESRYNGTNGWEFAVNAAGQVKLVGFNGASTNYTGVQSYQSVPLNKWVHVAAQLDMSTATLDATHSYIMFDGVSIPAQKIQGGTNPTSLIQAGNLEIGSLNGGGAPFPGKLAQVAIFSAAVSQATIQGYISQTLAGTETNLISAFSFNNSLNDLNTTNANNLTANNSATATNADSPFSINSFGTATGTTDYGIVTSATFSTNTTLVVQLPEANTIPTSGGVSAVSYSAQKAPYGMLVDPLKWIVQTLIGLNLTTSVTVAGTAYASLCQLSLPVGQFEIGPEGTGQVGGSSAGVLDGSIWVNTSSAIDGDTLTRIQSSPAGTYADANLTQRKLVNNQAQTTYTVYGTVSTGSGTLSYLLLGMPYTGAAPPCFKLTARFGLL